MTKSYISNSMGLMGRISEARNLLRTHREAPTQRVPGMVRSLREAKLIIEEAYGQPLKNKNILEIGPGQTLAQSLFFGVDNQITGLDFDVVVPNPNIRGYWRMFRKNGLMRVAKTGARHLLGIDREFRRAMARELQVQKLRLPDLHTGDATRMGFPDESFDAVVSFAVFEHIDRPAEALSEIKRVLKPGGVAYISLHLYTSDSGNHDVRVNSQQRDGIPYWAHLRPRYQGLVQSNSYLNKVRLADWESMFVDRWSEDCRFFYFGESENPVYLAELQNARSEDDLKEFEDRELLTVSLSSVWRKPIQ